MRIAPLIVQTGQRILTVLKFATTSGISSGRDALGLAIPGVPAASPASQRETGGRPPQSIGAEHSAKPRGKGPPTADDNRDGRARLALATVAPADDQRLKRNPAVAGVADRVRPQPVPPTLLAKTAFFPTLAPCR